MRVGNLDGRLVLLAGSEEGPGGGSLRALDVERASRGSFGPDPQSAFANWAAFRSWADGQDVTGHGDSVPMERLGPPVPRPPQVFGIGLNYRDHAAEAGLELPHEPMVFTKFPSSIAGPYAEVRLPSDRVDWEVELVLAVATETHQVPVEQAWDHVAGVTVGQDVSERRVQFRDRPPQFSLGKSYPGFSPIGPVLVTPDELADRDRLRLTCELGQETVQDGTTADMVFPVAELVARLAAVVRLLPGDLIFTGTPAGVGSVRDPRRYLAPGEVLTSTIEGIGRMRTAFV